MEEIASIRAVIVKMDILVTRKLDAVPRVVPLVMREFTVTKVNNKLSNMLNIVRVS